MNELTNNTEPQIAYSECYAQVFLGDCLELYKNIEPKSIDLILTDLPYGTTACKWDTIIPFDKLWEMVNHLLKPNGAFITTASQPFTSALVMSNPKMFKHQWQWIKNKPTGAFSAKYMPMKKHEMILVFGNPAAKYNPQMIIGEPYKRNFTYNKMNNMQFGIVGTEHYNSGTRHPSTILDFPQKWRRQDQIHPTQKPVELIEWLIKSYSNENDIILDNCIGCGTTAVAAIKTNRNFIGFDIEKKYCDIATKRIEELINL